jgi:Flp pilus assembly protein TadD
MSIADIAAAGGDTESARAILAAAAAADPKNGELQLRYAQALLQSGHPDEAIGVARQTVEQHPNDPALVVHAAQLELRADDPALAASTFRTASTHGAIGTSALNGLGVARVQLGDLPGAEEAFRKAIALAPGDYAARNNLALALVLQGRAAEAVPMLQSLANEPGVPDRVRHNLALAYAQQGNPQQAATVLADVMGSSAASREIAAFDAMRSEAPTALASQLAPAQVIQGKTSGVAYAGKIPGPSPSGQVAAGQVATGQVAGVGPLPVRPAPVAAVQATPITPPPPVKIASVPPSAPAATVPAPSVAPQKAAAVAPAAPTARPVADAPLPQVITPTQHPPAETAVAVSAPLPAPAPTPAGAAVPATPPGAAPPSSAATPANVRTITVTEPAANGTIQVRIASVPNRSAALTLWQNLAGMEPDLFNGRTPVVQEANERGKLEWHLGTGGFHDVASAERFCRQLRLRGPNCTVGL